MANSNKGDDKKSTFLSQIIPPVVIAILVGGTSPWWYSEFFKKPPPETNSPLQKRSPPQLDISGEWFNPTLGYKSTITQNGDRFQFQTTGISAYGDPFQSSGTGTIDKRDFEYDYTAYYQSGTQSEGHCSGAVSANEMRMTSTCTDSIFGTFVFSSVRQ